MESKDLKWLYSTILSTPGMEDSVKLDFRVRRKLVLLLVQLIGRGLEVKGNGFPEAVEAPLLEELQQLSQSFLEKAGLQALSDNLKRLQH
ncbi:MAG TPA: hypothetical protein VIR29_07345 [Anseongella sp.]